MVSHKVGLDSPNFFGHIEEGYTRRRIDLSHTEKPRKTYSFEKGD